MLGLAKGFSEKDCQVSVFTNIASESSELNGFGFDIIRKWSLLKLFKEVRKSDVFIEANFSLKTALVGLLLRKKWVIIHHGIYDNTWKGALKRHLTKLVGLNICVSQFVANHIKGKSIVIPNFYNSKLFRNTNIERNRDIVFLGRLVNDKGADILIKAIELLNKKDRLVTATVIGRGPEYYNLKSLVEYLGLESTISFTGALSGDELVNALNQHKVMVVPSLCEEAFGVVVLEGLACGCKLIVSNRGGLPDSIGRLGLIYKAESIEALAEALEKMLYINIFNANEVEVQNYLSIHNESSIVNRYLEAITKI